MLVPDLLEWRMVRIALVVLLLSFLAGCQAAGPRRPAGETAADGDAISRLVRALPGDYDNHEQVAHAAAMRKSDGAIAPLQVQHGLRVVESGRDGTSLLWRLAIAGQQTTAVWLLRIQASADGRHLRLLPFRPLDAALAQKQFVDPVATFRFDAAQWAALEPCAQSGQWDNAAFSAAASVEACSALLPGLGQEAALLPLRFTLAQDMLHVATFADTSRGSDAIEDARRVRWFDGWAAINGGGPQARSDNNDWHLQRDLRLSSEGGRVNLRWRDGAASGYSLQLERTSYPERKLAVLQLEVIEDASGRIVTYAWSDPAAASLGFNLGWLQAGFVQQVAAP
jgi:hypothetical protein